MAKLRIEPWPEGVVISVRAKPASHHNAVQGVHDGALRVCVTAAPEKGKANKSIGELLAKTLGIAKSHVQLIAGKTSSHKRFLVKGMAAEEILGALLPTMDD